MKSPNWPIEGIQAKKRSRIPAPKTFLAEEGPGRAFHHYRRHRVIFRQGRPADAAYYLQKGLVRLSVVVSREQKDKTILLFGAGDFLGEECIARNKLRRMATATAVTDCSALKIEKKQMLRLLREQPALSDFFVAFLLDRNRRIQEGLVDQLFSSSEKRLARTLLLLARLGAPSPGEEGRREVVIPHVTQRMLAEMIGATRQRVNYLLNRFRTLGFIDCDGGLKVHRPSLSAIVTDY